MHYVFVEQMTNGKGYAPRQYIIHTPMGRFFQSYMITVAFIPADGGKIQLDECYWDYSRTTGRYRNQFLGEDRSETEAKIEAGEYELKDLN